MKIIIIFLGHIFLLLLNIKAQVGGSSTYSFLNLSTSARIAASGGRLVAHSESDITLIGQNPALLESGMDKNLALSYTSLFDGAGYGYATYAFDKVGIGSFAGSVQYVDYGTFRGADRYGNLQENFYAKDLVFQLIFSRSLDSTLQIGFSFKPLYSIYERYTSLGVIFDVGIIYHSKNHNLTAGLVIRNMGRQIKSYTGKNENVPFEIIAGISQKLAYAPFRFTLTAHHLQIFNMYYESNLYQQNIAFNTKSKEEELFENILRHIIASIEFLPSKGIYLIVSYNYQRKQEMALLDAPGLTGFSFGGGIQTQKFTLSYGRSVYHSAGGANHFTIALNLGNFIHKH